MILAIDPGNIESAYVVLDENLKPIRFGKINNFELLNMARNGEFKNCDHVAIEMIANMGMSAVGATLFDTCVWVGRFWEALINKIDFIAYIYRREEKINLCGSMKAKDSNIRQALIDRFGIVGVKKSPGWFYGVSKDVWSAIAIGCTYYDLYLNTI